MIKEFIKRFLPDSYIEKKLKDRLESERNNTLKKEKIEKEEIIKLLIEDLQIKTGDTVFVHSSVNNLNLNFSSLQILSVLKDIIGTEGNILMPTYPKLTSYRFLQSKQVFNVRKTPTYTGFLNEMLRRSKGAVRSLHPTKSVTALGKDAHWLTAEHDKSIYPYSQFSPYYKAIELDAKIVGLGVKTTYLSCVHCVDDYFAEDFEYKIYYPQQFQSKCIDYNGNEVNINTLAHNMSKMDFDLPMYFKKLVDDSICRDFTFKEQPFFIADSKLLFNEMVKLAEEGKSIYSKVYRK